MGARRGFHTHHDNASRLLHSAHTHNGGHANSGALEVNPTAKDRSMQLNCYSNKGVTILLYVVAFDLKCVNNCS